MSSMVKISDLSTRPWSISLCLRRIDRGDAGMMGAHRTNPFGVMMPSRSCSGVRPDADRYATDPLDIL